MVVERKSIEYEMFGWYDKVVKLNQGLLGWKPHHDNVLTARLYSDFAVGVPDYKPEYFKRGLLAEYPTPVEPSHLATIAKITTDRIKEVENTLSRGGFLGRLFGPCVCPTIKKLLDIYEWHYTPVSDDIREALDDKINLEFAYSKNMLQTVAKRVIIADRFLPPEEPDYIIQKSRPDEWLFSVLDIKTTVNAPRSRVIYTAAAGDIMSAATIGYFEHRNQYYSNIVPGKLNDEIVDKIHQWYMRNGDKVQVIPVHEILLYFDDLKYATYKLYEMDDNLMEEVKHNIIQNLELIDNNTMVKCLKKVL